ncbi:MAG TPA: methyltransferase domain-containing protein [Gemmatales bacterium]|nr:methyltransferase domain-containing protein [Gemmatales bacterium]HMP16317.1 methyltransferase domain-containing protein [Gemmatales bacterium]
MALVRSVGKSTRKTSSHTMRVVWARQYLRGRGIEVGALSRPVPLSTAQVSYYDRCSEAELAELYPHCASRLVPLDGIAELESLACLDDATQNFVIACKVLEYSNNVLAAFQAIYRVLKTGGMAFLTVCDKRKTIDCHRPVSTIGQLAADYVHGPQAVWSIYQEDWASFVEHGPGQDRDARLQLMVQHAWRTRQHVWTPLAWMQLLTEVQGGLGFELLAWQSSGKEIITVLQKQRL